MDSLIRKARNARMSFKRSKNKDKSKNGVDASKYAKKPPPPPPEEEDDDDIENKREEYDDDNDDEIEENAPPVPSKPSKPAHLVADDETDDQYEGLHLKATPRAAKHDYSEDVEDSVPEPVEEFVEEVPAFGMGGYLRFEAVSDGILNCVFSETEVPDALAYFKPNKRIPPFKFKDKQGRMELIRGLMTKKEKWFVGIIEFLKIVRKFDGDIIIMDPKARIYCFEDLSLKLLEPGKFVNLTSCSAVAACPPHFTDFEGVMKMSLDNFISTSNKVGLAYIFRD